MSLVLDVLSVLFDCAEACSSKTSQFQNYQFSFTVSAQEDVGFFANTNFCFDSFNDAKLFENGKCKVIVSDKMELVSIIWF